MGNGGLHDAVRNSSNAHTCVRTHSEDTPVIGVSDITVYAEVYHVLFALPTVVCPRRLVVLTRTAVSWPPGQFLHLVPLLAVDVGFLEMVRFIPL